MISNFCKQKLEYMKVISKLKYVVYQTIELETMSPVVSNAADPQCTGKQTIFPVLMYGDLAHQSAAGSPIKRVQDAVKKGRKLLASRQKMILLADRSPYGWDVVRQYEVDELAE